MIPRGEKSGLFYVGLVGNGLSLLSQPPEERLYLGLEVLDHGLDLTPYAGSHGLDLVLHVGSDSLQLLLELSGQGLQMGLDVPVG